MGFGHLKYFTCFQLFLYYFYLLLLLYSFIFNDVDSLIFLVTSTGDLKPYCHAATLPWQLFWPSLRRRRGDLTTCAAT